MTDLVERVARAIHDNIDLSADLKIDMATGGEFSRVAVAVIEAAALEQSTLEIKEYREALSWQPIETAPTDGTEFLAIDEETGFSQVVDYDVGVAGPDYVWCVSDGVTYRHDAFTHWMPLPKPPSRAALNHHEGSEG